MGRSLRAWKKVLYEKQNYPDNYVDPEQFLNGLRKNRTLQFSITDLKIIKILFTSIVFTKTYELQELVTASGVVAQEVSR